MIGSRVIVILSCYSDLERPDLLLSLDLSHWFINAYVRPFLKLVWGKFSFSHDILISDYLELFIIV
jgi:hypothetical protein